MHKGNPTDGCERLLINGDGLLLTLVDPAPACPGPPFFCGCSALPLCPAPASSGLPTTARMSVSWPLLYCSPEGMIAEVQRWPGAESLGDAKEVRRGGWGSVAVAAMQHGRASALPSWLSLTVVDPIPDEHARLPVDGSAKPHLSRPLTQQPHPAARCPPPCHAVHRLCVCRLVPPVLPPARRGAAAGGAAAACRGAGAGAAAGRGRRPGRAAGAALARQVGMLRLRGARLHA